MKKYAIRKLIRNKDGSLTSVFIDSQTGEIIQDLSQYEVSNLESYDGENTEANNENNQSEESTPTEPSSDEDYNSTGSVFDNNTVFDNPKSSIREVQDNGVSVKSNDNSRLPNEQDKEQNSPTKSEVKKDNSLVIDEGMEPKKSSNAETIFQSIMEKGSKGRLSDFDRTGLSDKTNRLVDEMISMGFGDLGVNSGFRSPSKNKSVGGASRSQHTFGNAIDLKTRDLSDQEKERVLDSAMYNGAKGIGIYPGGSIHVDTRNTPGYWGVNGRYTNPGNTKEDKINYAIDNLPDWAKADLTALRDADGNAYLPSGSNNNVPVPEARPIQTEYENRVEGQGITPAKYAALGYSSRSPEEKGLIGLALAGELSPKTLDGISIGDQNSIQEAVNMIGAIENRSIARGNSIATVLDPVQINAMDRANMSTTKGNYGMYGKAVDDLVNSFYEGRLSKDLTSPEATHWANMSISNPSWADFADTSEKVGDHTFFSGMQTGDRSGYEYSLPDMSSDVPDKSSKDSVDTSVEDKSVDGPTSDSMGTERTDRVSKSDDKNYDDYSRYSVSGGASRDGLSSSSKESVSKDVDETSDDSKGGIGGWF